MTSLLELASQGDVGTIADESKLSTVTLMTPQELYELWERQNWQSHTIDFSRDLRDWEAMDDDLREHLAWNLSSFFVGEERVTTQFSGLVMAYESQSEEAFLTTQQVDEARHAQHFNRFYEQVLDIDGTFEDRLRRAREDLSPIEQARTFSVLLDLRRFPMDEQSLTVRVVPSGMRALMLMCSRVIWVTGSIRSASPPQRTAARTPSCSMVHSLLVLGTAPR